MQGPTDSGASRFAWDHLRLRDSDGRIAATEGRPLPVQSGFSFPWEEDLLVPAHRLLSTGDLQDHQRVEIGNTEDWFTLRSGPWTLWFRIAQALWDSLSQALSQTRGLIATLKREKKQNRLVGTTLASLKQLQSVDV